MASRYVVDTHAVVWFIEGNPRLGERAADVLRDQASELLMSAVAFGEARWMVEHGKTKIHSLDAFLAAVDSERRHLGDGSALARPARRNGRGDYEQ